MRRELLLTLAAVSLLCTQPVAAQTSEQMREAARCAAESHRYQHHLVVNVQLSGLRQQLDTARELVEEAGGPDADDPRVRETVMMVERLEPVHEVWKGIYEDSGATEWLFERCPLARHADSPDIAAFLRGEAMSADPLDRSDFHPRAVEAACSGELFNYWCHAMIDRRGFVAGVAEPDVEQVMFEERDRSCRAMHDELAAIDRGIAGMDAGTEAFVQETSRRHGEILMEAAQAPREELPRLYRELAELAEEIVEMELRVEHGDRPITRAKLMNTLDWDWCRRTGLDPRENPDERTENWRYADELAWCRDSHAWIRRNRDTPTTQAEVDRFNRNVSVYNDRCVGIRAGSRDIDAVCGGDDEGFCGGFNR